MTPATERFRAALLLSLIAAATSSFACGHASTAETPAAIASPEAAAQKSVKIWLNDEEIGSVDELDKLGEQIKAVMEIREKNAAYEDVPEAVNNNSSDLANLVAPVRLIDTVYLFIDPSITIGSFERIHRTISDNGGTVRIPRSNSAVRDARGEKPDPYFTAVTVGPKYSDKSALGLPTVDHNYKFSHGLLISDLVNINDQHISRLLGSIEILPDGRFVVNDRVMTVQGELGKLRILDNNKEVDPNKPLAEFKIKQRSVEAADLKKEFDKLFTERIDGKLRIKVVADEKAPYKSLMTIFESVSGNDVTFDVNVIRS